MRAIGCSEDCSEGSVETESGIVVLFFSEPVSSRSRFDMFWVCPGTPSSSFVAFHLALSDRLRAAWGLALFKTHLSSRAAFYESRGVVWSVSETRTQGPVSASKSLLLNEIKATSDFFQTG